MDLLERIEKEIKERVAELQPLALEYKRLREAHAALDRAEGRGRVQRQAATTAGTRPRSHRAPRGSARELVLAAATNDPQAKRGDIAKATGLSPNTVGTTLSKLRAEGLLPRPERSQSAANDDGQHRDATDAEAFAAVPSPQGVAEASDAENEAESSGDGATEVGTDGVKETPAKPSATPNRRRRATKAPAE